MNRHSSAQISNSPGNANKKCDGGRKLDVLSLLGGCSDSKRSIKNY